jgi:hypothetical protein
MKLIFAALLSLLSLSALAALTEVECTGRDALTTITTAVEEGFPPGSFSRAYVRVDGPNGSQLRNFTVMSRGSFGNRVRYEASGLSLEVDFWPDARPQWARTYRGNFSSTEMNIPFTMLWCRFPNIRP